MLPDTLSTRPRQRMLQLVAPEGTQRAKLLLVVNEAA